MLYVCSKLHPMGLAHNFIGIDDAKHHSFETSQLSDATSKSSSISKNYELWMSQYPTRRFEREDEILQNIELAEKKMLGPITPPLRFITTCDQSLLLVIYAIDHFFKLRCFSYIYITIDIHIFCIFCFKCF